MNGETFQQDEDQELELPITGMVRKLSINPHTLLSRLPDLRSSATIFRSPHTILCRKGRFSSFVTHQGFGYSNEGERGTTFCLDSWHETWLYYEEREGSTFPCLEVCDDHGRGIFKLCYTDSEAAVSALTQLDAHVVNQGNAWDILHLQKCNTLNCSKECRVNAPKNSFFDPVRAVMEECFDEGIEVGFVVPGDCLSNWDSVRLTSVSRVCCWLALGASGDFLYFQPSAIKRAELHGTGDRRVLSLFGADETPILSLIEPVGMTITGFEDVARIPSA